MIGQHCIRTWSSTQPSVTLSSGEAEYYGLVKAAGAGLGHQALMKDLGLEIPITVWTDSSAALGIATRSGLGKLRHLETHTLWVQEKVRTGAIAGKKVRGEVNPADLFTKHLASRENVHQLLGLFGCEYREGRAKSAPLLRPMDSNDRQGGHSVEGDRIPTYAADVEPEAHDESRLPHLHSDEEIDRFFPTIAAAPAQANLEDWNPDCVDELPQKGSDSTCVDELPQVNPAGRRKVDADHKTATAGPQVRSGRRRQTAADNK